MTQILPNISITCFPIYTFALLFFFLKLLCKISQ